MLPNDLSGTDIVKALSKLGFEAKRRKGSHVVLIKQTAEGKVGCTVPMHKEVKRGTLKGILEQAKVSEDEFLNVLK